MPTANMDSESYTFLRELIIAYKNGSPIQFHISFNLLLTI